MLVSRVHHCISQEYVAQGIEEPPAVKCRCRKIVSSAVATEMVKNGEARRVVVKRTFIKAEQTCRLCNGDPEVKLCANCAGKGVEETFLPVEEFSDDIVRVSRASKDPKEKKYRPALALKTPRVATIEPAHMRRAYLDEIKEAQERIEEYGRLTLDARMYHGAKRVLMIVPEPADDLKTGTGRKHDYGRPVLYNPSNQGTVSTEVGTAFVRNQDEYLSRFDGDSVKDGESCE